VDPETMKQDILSLNPTVPVLLTSKHDNESLKTWIEQLENGIKALKGLQK